MKTYQGTKTFDGEFEIQVVSGDSSLPLKPPPGYPSNAWGWGDEGGSEGLTGLSLLYDAIQDMGRARTCINEFVERVTGNLDPETGWTMDYYAIVAFADKYAPPSPVELL